ncbi:MAG: FlgD immunoglobulin-like domain containing protein, partial [Candidatus Latescibacteria bacterium]|nr:FlgD immunoglobulin-like domain containing protein [Candidatus Latescibacterota bacterium]
ADNLPSTVTTRAAIRNGAIWLASTQHVSGGWVYGSGNHYPEIGGEITAGLAAAAGATVTAAASGPDPVQCGQTKTVTFAYAPGDATPGLRGYEFVVKVAGPVATVTSAHFARAGGLMSVGSTVFYVVDEGGGVFSVNESILGTTPGLLVPGNLFTLVLTTGGTGVVDVTVESYRMRDPANLDIFADVSGVSFTVDCTMPPGVTGLTSAPGHEQVTLAWTMADASDVDHYEVWRAVWHTGDNVTSAYPEYDDDNPSQPVWPADHAAAVASLEWSLVTGVLPGTAVGYVDSYAPRGIYYYEVYAVDAAGNVGPGAGPMNRSTNYWLGDIDPPYDGDVDVPDIDELAAAFGYGHGIGGYNNEADVGPTDDTSSFGIPTTDNVIDFEDLMIFAMNFGNVLPRQPAGGTPNAVLAWTHLDGNTWALVLVEPCADLKGLRLRAGLPDGVACDVRAGELLDAQVSPAFVANIGRNGLDASLALLGRGGAIAGAGELLRVTFSADVTVVPEIDARRTDNGDLRVSQTTGNEPQTPARFTAGQNYPNPFNPKTTIAFALPEARHVRLGVYAVDGSLVRTLVDGQLAAGAHEIVWDGLDSARQRAATGTYFYRLVAGADTEVRKMTLVK